MRTCRADKCGKPQSSAALSEVFAKGRVARPVEDLDADTLKAIAEASVPEAHAALDHILKDWTP